MVALGWLGLIVVVQDRNTCDDMPGTTESPAVG
jgi:hypothetical protein